MAIPDARTLRRQKIIDGLRSRRLDEAVADPDLLRAMREEAASPDRDRLVTPDLLRLAERARAARLDQPPLGLFFSTDDVILVPGFLGSELVDVKGPDGLIWVDPKMLVDGTDKLLDLELNPLPAGPGVAESDADPAVAVRAHGAVPVIYSGLRYDLEVRRYSVQTFGFDWRKDIEEAAGTLAGIVRDRASRPFRKLHVVAHSQGTVVARRALQLVGADLARKLVTSLVLLGPATGGTFSAAFAIAGTSSLIDTVQKYGIVPPDGFAAVLQSMTGLYQLLPWRTDPVDQNSAGDKALEWVGTNAARFHGAGFWETGVDAGRLARKYGWGKLIDTSFLNDRTTIILGDQPTTGGVMFRGGELVEDPRFTTRGDGTVPDALARLEGVSRVYKARGTEHMMLPATLSVIAAVRDVLAGRPPQVETVAFGVAAEAAPGVPFLATPPDEPRAPRAVPVEVAPPGASPAQPPGPPSAPAVRPATAAEGRHRGRRRGGEESPLVPTPPANRRLRVYSFDPLFSNEIDAAGTDQVTVELPWDDGAGHHDDGDHLRPGPVGQYVEVVDYDPASGAFYPPVDLNHPHLLAQDGLPPSEGDPRFHQQMAYAVSMATIRRFEAALGRRALWAPRLIRDDAGKVVESRYVQRLRIYPHALRQANAYFDPGRHALLLGYFQAGGADVGRNLPGGTIFVSLSYDIIAHETTHALLNGLHRYLLEPSNPDVFAFHEAFADVVAMFQHFSHPEVLREQLRRARGDLAGENQLGVLAAQFGEAMGQRSGLRRYLGRRGGPDGAGDWEPVAPDPGKIREEFEPHGRGAILVAALFGAFRNIYENRVADLRRIATGGTGVLPAGDLHPDLVNRMAAEAAKAARHLLTMCIRALDYIPPVDITFGEYLRALVTADSDLVVDDDLGYRRAVVAAFRDWGIYPPDVRSLSVASLLWRPPELEAFQHPIDLFRGQLAGWDLRADRRAAFDKMRDHQARFHGWLSAHLRQGRDHFLGLYFGPDPDAGPDMDRGPHLSIPRDGQGRPVFEVHNVRPCRRIGPDGQQREEYVIEVVQRRLGFFDEQTQLKVDAGDVKPGDARPDFSFRGGCTLVVDPESGDVRYCVRKAITGPDRLARERQFRLGQFADPAGGAYLAADDGRDNPFAFLHGGS